MKLIDVLKPDYIKIPLECSTKEESIKALIEVLNNDQIFPDPNTIYEAVMEREKIMTTGVGRGIAIPHCKNDGCKEFAIALGICPEGINFDSIDDMPAKVIFLLVGPENNPGMHIRLLSRISRLISKDVIRDELIACKDNTQAFRLLEDEEAKYFEISS